MTGSSSGEDSPDWLRSFQAPTHSTLTLSSSSDSSPNATPPRDDGVDSQFPEGDNSHQHSPSLNLSKAKAPPLSKKNTRKTKREGDVGAGLLNDEEMTEKLIEAQAAKHSVWTLSSDSESCPDNSPARENAVLVSSSGVSPVKKLSKKLVTIEGHPLKKEKLINDNIQREGNLGDMEVAEEGASEKYIDGPHVSTTRLPLMLSEKVHRSKALLECEGDSIDLSGDMGAVGRIVIPDTPSGNSEMYFDLKGTIYRTKILPSRTFCVVSFGQSEAKIEAIMNDFIQLQPQSNVYEAETMVEGTLEGFSFDSEDETDKMPKASHQVDHEGDEEPTDGKTKGKAEKSSGAARKKGKTAGKLQPAKKIRKKTQVSKKAKTKK